MVTKDQQIAFLRAFKETFREELMMDNVIHFNGIGKFTLNHVPQHQEKKSDGQVIMVPPENRINFESEYSK
jgi:nucleoid DNA-binding protein